MRKAITGVAIAALIAVWPAVAAAPPSPAKLAALQRANRSLTVRVAQLSQQLQSATDQLATAQSSLDTATANLQTTQAQLSAAQASTAAALSSMTASAIWNTDFNALIAVFRASRPRFDVSTFDQGNYKTVEFTYCGFC